MYVYIYMHMYIYWARGFQVTRGPGGSRTGIILNMAGVLKTTSLVQSDGFNQMFIFHQGIRFSTPRRLKPMKNNHFH